MARRYKILFGFIFTIFAGCSGWILVHATYPGRWPSGYPLTLRLPEVAYIVPGFDRVIAWEARRDARREFQADRKFLLGLYEGGTTFGFEDQCQIIEYERRSFQDRDFPPWASNGLRGTIQLACKGAESVALETFGVLEMGCIDERGSHFYSREHNKRMLELSLLTSRIEKLGLNKSE